MNVAAAESEALRQAGLDGEGAPMVIVGADDWHPGIVGLVAARLKERYRRPAFALAFQPDGLGAVLLADLVVIVLPSFLAGASAVIAARLPSLEFSAIRQGLGRDLALFLAECVQ